MGKLIDGVWQKEAFAPETEGGRFVRPDSPFRGWVSRDGSTGFPAEPGRYHLYVSLACPWAHRTLIFRKLKGLEEAISVSVVDPIMGEEGWHFSEGPGCIPDTVNGCAYLREVYVRGDPHYTGRVTVPLLWDKQAGTAVSNESADIIRMLNSAFDDYADAGVDFYPEELRAEIDAVNAWVYDDINNGVYRTGFAQTQEAYEEAFDSLFAALDAVETRLAEYRYLVGNRLTEADWRLFTTLVRFDPVYYGHFKCNRQRVTDFPSLSGYLRDLYQVPKVAETVNLDHIKRHYYGSHPTLNPTAIVPKGPLLDYGGWHDRGRFPHEGPPLG
ncbi:glutathionyl-hydroquinone reductase YqjG [Thiohalorhabdus denitrificans]|uniref:Putative glutathione S-transferase n=1 Tax=Thiohalorhabdus denitrificans TaxID=381306 RepID=A0A0P9C2N3_9GAMM|nr:glutathione S-transferase family protein [Thiohalorhabdus denitrificans]KPV39202.1 glutathionyl-hydroquinone reductase YqjG [Thiohalorhabdus denitrificans]SCX75364.1 putative glutathione S-transferase [Thiohalorhabdus denitrificans]